MPHIGPAGLDTEERQPEEFQVLPELEGQLFPDAEHALHRRTGALGPAFFCSFLAIEVLSFDDVSIELVS